MNSVGFFQRAEPNGEPNTKLVHWQIRPANFGGILGARIGDNGDDGCC